ncbi:TonB-dependent receptor protein [Acetobacter nitrogenifigens DSM 23921 = NBRC 105050]|uniref:Ligand-gated channel protein n=2 Tax=Acetobacter nitrogenifigens TaxID=285268 RepID=A0A511XCT8_9PROT|nr:TonB-dependent receptor protein [Acetobacter nitrogenifigens DSM 23921 = NBRC 105050]GEN60777.1 ligand-gated channel protein [Acetobacter nitrogenifigens DSM 23921 = NBRC 105050]
MSSGAKYRTPSLSLALGSLAMGASLGAPLASANDQTQSPQRHKHHHRHVAEASKPATNTPSPAPGYAPAAALNGDEHAARKTGRSAQSGDGESLLVTGRSMNILNDPIGIGRMPQDIMHTPQTVNAVPRILMEQQNVKSLDEALRDVPGVTASVGEGEGGMSGDQFLIRGFQAQNDIYENGLRDFGVYTRDSFDYDHISVIKGPSSEVFGNGTTGGAINITTKVAHLGNNYGAQFSGGSGEYYRGTLDFNQQIGEHTAIRITGMGNENNEVGRDNIYSHRWGLAPSIGFGLGTKTTFTLEYFHQSDNRIPDYGVPVITKPGTAIARPATEYGLNRHNWYGTNYDQDVTNENMLTGRLQSEISQYITVFDDLRGGMYQRWFSASQPGCDTTCASEFFTDPSAATVDRRGHLGGPEPYQQNDWSVQNVFSVLAKFKTGSIKHEMIAGWDVEHVYDRRTNYAYNFNGQNGTASDTTSLVHPSHTQTGLLLGGAGQYQSNLVNISGVGRALYKTGDATDVGAFFSEQMWVAPWFSIKGGFRWDHWNSHYSANGGMVGGGVHYGQQQDTFNPTVSLMYTPSKNTMVYFNWARSTTPLGLYVTNSSEPLKSSTQGFKPEQSSLYELGIKQQFFHGRLGATASVFRLEKGNAMMTDPSTGTVSSSSDRQRNQGVELSLSGQILKNWNVIGTYAYYDATTTWSLTAADVGKRIQYAPKNMATLWTTYTIAPDTPWNVTFGGGLTWRDAVYLNAANTARVPHTMDWDAMISHNIGHRWRMALNGYNLTNRVNYSNLFSDRATPSVGRTFLGSLSFTY